MHLLSRSVFRLLAVVDGDVQRFRKVFEYLRSVDAVDHTRSARRRPDSAERRKESYEAGRQVNGSSSEGDVSSTPALSSSSPFGTKHAQQSPLTVIAAFCFGVTFAYPIDCTRTDAGLVTTCEVQVVTRIHTARNSQEDSFSSDDDHVLEDGGFVPAIFRDPCVCSS